MPLTNHFAALVTFEPAFPSHKTYALRPIQPHHGETVDDVI